MFPKFSKQRSNGPSTIILPQELDNLKNQTIKSLHSERA